jgi:L-threonylcarbamoyladenylate synthase
MEQKTARLGADSAGIAAAAKLLAAGGLVAFPTETVYGLGADARNDAAVAAIYAAKGRPSFNPLIVHVANQQAAAKYAEFSDAARQLAMAFWPGPLSLVLPVAANAGLSDRVTAGLDSVALRVPAHPLGHALLSAFGGPVAAPSANISGRVSPTTPQHVLDGLDGRIKAVLMGGACDVGLESTILSVIGDKVSLLRAGGITAEAIENLLGQAIGRSLDPDRPQSPGQMASHYAPAALIRLNVTKPRADEVLLGFGDQAQAVLNLSLRGDLAEAASNLFAMLRQIDLIAQEKQARIAVAPVPMHGLGLAINDRLTRAAAPR